MFFLQVPQANPIRVIVHYEATDVGLACYRGRRFGRGRSGGDGAIDGWKGRVIVLVLPY